MSDTEFDAADRRDLPAERLSLLEEPGDVCRPREIGARGKDRRGARSDAEPERVLDLLPAGECMDHPREEAVTRADSACQRA